MIARVIDTNWQKKETYSKIHDQISYSTLPLNAVRVLYEIKKINSYYFYFIIISRSQGYEHLFSELKLRDTHILYVKKGKEKCRTLKDSLCHWLWGGQKRSDFITLSQVLWPQSSSVSLKIKPSYQTLSKACFTIQYYAIIYRLSKMYVFCSAKQLICQVS